VEACPVSRADRILIAAGGSAVVLTIAAVAMLLLPVEAATDGPEASAAVLLFGSPVASPAGAPASERAGSIVVDVEGGVLEPGIRELPAGSRVADAIAAAGGYASDADLVATAAAINLAQPLADGQQIVVPRVGDAVPAASAAVGGGGGGGATGALVDLNTATPEELEALPGIGAVTVQKIVAARQERPFASLEDAVERGVINRGQLEDLQGLATAG
jgi:competence protein ComEA